MNKKTSHHAEAGFSLIELFIALLVLGILVTFAVLAFGSSASKLERQNIAREFKVGLERARYDSVKRRPSTCDQMSRVEITSATSFRVLTDTNRNGSIEASVEASNFEFGNRGNTEIIGNSLTFPIVIRFDGRGQTSSGTCASLADTYSTTTFCETPCTLATATAENATLVYVSLTGTTAYLNGGESIPSFTAPSVSDVDPSVQINPLLSVWNLITGGTPTPTPSGTPPLSTPTPDPSTPTPTPDPGTPTPTPDPSVTPTPTPTPSVTPTPTPTATPSPTPTPLPDCSLNQRPGSPPVCTCRLPWVVGHNGKCQP